MSLAGAPGSLKRLAIVAHYDPDGEVHAHVYELLRQLREVAADIIIVSTNLGAAGAAALEPYGMVLTKPNLGYDFASWRLGIEEARRHFRLSDYDEILTVNDSFYLLRDGVLAAACDEAAVRELDIWSLTASQQVLFHLQSFFLAFRRGVFEGTWFDRFWSGVWEYGDRDFVVSQYELALTQQAQAAGLRVGTLFDPATSPLVPAIDRGVNPTHILWKQLARAVGIAKVELVQRNPHRLDISTLLDLAAPAQLAALRAHKRVLGGQQVAMVHPVDEAAQFARQSAASVAVHVHLHYSELVDELMLATRQVPVPCDVFVTVTDTVNLGLIVKRIKAHRRDSRILLVDNRGRDILPFVSLLNAGVFAPYAAVCKVHSKRSTYSQRGDQWRKSLVSPLLGSSASVLDILDAFRVQDRLGVVVPRGAFVREGRHWGGNRPRVEVAAGRMGGGFGPGHTPLAFPAGSMYWFRPAALEPLRKLQLTENDFETEAGAQDATMAHVVERLVGISAWISGHDVAETDALDVALTPMGEDSSSIPVF